ncbi:hypothetical protein ES707_14515 [subsurface metagenome]
MSLGVEIYHENLKTVLSKTVTVICTYNAFSCAPLKIKEELLAFMCHWGMKAHFQTDVSDVIGSVVPVHGFAAFYPLGFIGFAFFFPFIYYCFGDTEECCKLSDIV